MPQLDRLLAVLVSRRGDSIRLVQDEPAFLMRGAETQALTRGPLTPAQMLTIVREVAPADTEERVERGEGAHFEYTMGTDAFVGRVHREKGRLTLDVTPRVPVNGAPRPTPAVIGSVVPRGDHEAQAAMDELLRNQATRKASDLHLRSGERPLYRVDGDIVPETSGEPLSAAFLERMLLSIMPERNKAEFEELNDTDLAYELEGIARFRVNVFRDRHGVGSVIRAISSKVVTAEEMGITPEVQRLCELSKGLVLVTGPTGSGKSTTLCGLIDLVNRTRRDHIITIEDPIEFVHANKGCLITQRQVGQHTSSFKQALRAALREDPDVVLVGELRDLETVSIAIETAETGHLVFGTLHTSTAPSTIDRIIDQFPADRQSQVRVMLSESLKGVISQTLCKKIGGGRVAAREILLTNTAISNLIREAKTFQVQSVMQTSRRLGMVTLTDALVELVDKGQVEVSEAYAKAIDKSMILQALKSKGHDTSFAEKKIA
ncbi:MAG TPA: type IV pilus twitching motility protein PilT [Gemmatimonadaceae bacterium]